MVIFISIPSFWYLFYFSITLQYKIVNHSKCSTKQNFDEIVIETAFQGDAVTAGHKHKKDANIKYTLRKQSRLTFSLFPITDYFPKIDKCF